MRRFAALLLCAAVPLFGPTPAAAEAERHLLLRIADAEDPGRADALAAWQALSDADRTKRTREALGSEDPALAFAAAVVASPWSLDLQELGLRSRAMERDPFAWFSAPDAFDDVADDDVAFGSRDLPAIWRALAAPPEHHAVPFTSLHRALLPEQVPGLVPLLERTPPTEFRALLEDLRLLAESVGERRDHDVFVRAFRYGLLRLRAEHAKKSRPTFADLAAHATKPGLPGEFLELARGCWAPDGGGFDLGGHAQEPTRDGLRVTAPHVRGTEYWLHRWALRLTPVPEDAPQLVELIESRAPAQTKAWAARRIAAMEGRAPGHALQRVLANAGPERVWAAAERAARGDRAAWNAVVSAVGLGREGADAVLAARWLADLPAAKAAAWTALRERERPAGLEVEERWIAAQDFALDVPEEVLDALGARLESEPAPLTAATWFVASAHPEWLTPERAARMAARLAERAPEAPFPDATMRVAVARLAAFAPEATRSMLRRWATEATDDEARLPYLTLLARLGDADLAETLIAAWPSFGAEAPALLGRVRTPGVEAFLRREAASADTDREAGAVEGLAVFHGCPDLLARYLGPAARGDPELSADTWTAVKSLVLAKDPIGAVLRRTHGGPYVQGVTNEEICAFGLVKDPRVRERLEIWRDRREFRLHWVANACLATQGDERARADWRGFLAEARVFLLDQLQLWRLFTLDGEPQWSADWVARLDANCCYGWHAQECLKATFPTFPFGHYPSGAGRTRRGAERWFERHRETFVWSPILDGWIPGPRP